MPTCPSNPIRDSSGAYSALRKAIAHCVTPHRKTLGDSALDYIVAETDRRARIIELVQEALSQLRLDMKYLIFDLEATRRERDELRQQLDELQQ